MLKLKGIRISRNLQKRGDDKSQKATTFNNFNQKRVK